MVAYYRSGSTPDQALAKVAEDTGLAVDLLRLVGRGFNAGQTLTEMQRGESIADKTAGAHPLVDIEGVLQSVFAPTRELTVADDVVSPIYSLKQAADMPAATEKVASATVQTVSKDESTERPAPWISPDLYSASEKMAARVAWRHWLHELDRNVDVCQTDLVVKTADFTSELRTLVDTDPERIPELRKDAGDYLGEWSVRALDRSLDSVLTKRQSTSLRKKATAECTDIRRHPSTPDQPLLRKLAACGESGCACGKSVVNQLKGRLVTAKAHRMMNGQDKPPRSISPTDDTAEKKAEVYLEKFGFTGGAILTNGLINMLSKNRGVDPSSTNFREAELNLADPEHEQSLKNIRIRASLQDLLDYDPVLQSYDPETVLSAFNELSQATPASLENPIALQAGLRRLLQGDVALHESAQLGADEMQNRKMLTPLTAQVSNNGTKVPR